MNNQTLVWNKPGDLSGMLDIQSYGDSQLNGDQACARCGRLLNDHGLLVYPGTNVQEPKLICPGTEFEGGLGLPKKQKADTINEADAIIAQATLTLPEDADRPTNVADLPSSVQRMRGSLGAVHQAIAQMSPEYMTAAPVVEEAAVAQQDAPQAEQTQPIQTLTTFMPKKLSPKDILYLAGIHPAQPVVYEVEPAEHGSGYQIVRYSQVEMNGQLDKFRIDTHHCGSMPRYDVDELRLRLQVKAGYEYLVATLGG